MGENHVENCNSLINSEFESKKINANDETICKIMPAAGIRKFSEYDSQYYRDLNSRLADWNLFSKRLVKPK